jgi:hypothetical protein
MTPLAVIGYLILLFIVLVIVRAFWLEIAIIGYVLYITAQLIGIALASAILWAVFVTKSAAGWGWTWLFFFIAYGAIAVVAAMIANDIFGMIGDALVRFFRRLR